MHGQEKTEEFMDGVEEFMTVGTPAEEFSDNVEEFLGGGGSLGSSSDDGSDDEFSPMGSVRDLFEQVGDFTKSDACEAMAQDIIEIGLRSATHQDAASVLREANEPQAASKLESVARKEKGIAEDLIGVADTIGCDIPDEVRKEVRSL